MIRPYSILIRILAKFMETLFLTTLCSCMRHKTTAQWNNRLLLVSHCKLGLLFSLRSTALDTVRQFRHSLVKYIGLDIDGITV